MANHELGVECFCFECLRKRGAQPSNAAQYQEVLKELKLDSQPSGVSK